MKAVALTGLRQLEVLELAAPRIQKAQEVLLKIERVGICGSDMHYFETGRIADRAAPFPFRLGHECSATVLETGGGVTRVTAGDAVAVDPAMSCFACDQCRQGRPHTCRKLRFLGCPGEAEGCLGELLVMPENSLYPTGGRLTWDQAALCEPLSIGLYAARLASPLEDARVAILGSGPIGLCAMLAARQARAESVFMTDRLPYRVEFARGMGCDWAGNPDAEDVPAALQQAAPGGLDVVFECAGQQATLDQGVALLKPGGKLVIVGIPREDRVSFHIDSLRRKEIAVINVRRQNDYVQPAIESIANGAIRPDALVTHRFKLEQAQEAFEMVAHYANGVIKVMIEF